MNNEILKIAAVVDPYSTGLQIPKILKKEGYNVIHIQCGKDEQLNPLDVKDINLCSNYIDKKIILEHQTDLGIVSQLLKDNKVSLVLPGYEGVVDIAEKLANMISVKTNSPDRIEQRSNKYKMHLQVNADQLKIPKQKLCSTFQEAEKWIYEEQKQVLFPLIVKPINSAGTEGICFCEDISDVQKAFSKFLNKLNILKRKNEELLVQEYIRGKEYVVNALSMNGIHYPTDFWTYKKMQIKKHHFIYDSIELLHPSEVPIQITEYHKKSLDSLGYIWGPSHGEFYLLSDGQVLLGEIGARAPGAHLPDGLKYSTRFDFMKTSVLAYTNPHAATKSLEMLINVYKEASKEFQYCRIVLLVSKKKGLIQTINEELFSEIKSLKEYHLNFGVGEVLEETIDLVTCPGICLLVSNDREQLNNDHIKIRKIEADLFN